jgi:hypothetical protein
MPVQIPKQHLLRHARLRFALLPTRAGLASEIETMEMVSLRLEDHGLPSHAVLNASPLARGPVGLSANDKADVRKYALCVAFGGKPDMASCSANVRL